MFERNEKTRSHFNAVTAVAINVKNRVIFGKAKSLATCLVSFVSISVAVSAALVPTFVPSSSDAATPEGWISLSTIQLGNGKSYTVKVPMTSSVVLQAHSPSHERDAWKTQRAEVEAMCRGSAFSRATKDFVVNYIPEKLAMDTAYAISAAQQLRKSPTGDPAAIKHWWQHSFEDPTAYASFAAFMLGNRAVGSYLSMTGIIMDPCRVLARTPVGPLALEEKMSEKMFRLLGAPLLGMAGGSIASSLVSDILTDKNVQLCASSFLYDLNASQKRAAQQACDTSYQDWVVSGRKINHYMPELLSSMGTAFVLAVPSAAVMVGGAPVSEAAVILAQAGMRALPDTARLRATGAAAATVLSLDEIAAGGVGNVIRVQSLQVVMRVGLTAMRMTPVPIVRMAVNVGSLIVFFNIHDKLFNFVNDQYQPWAQGNKITESINSLSTEMSRAQAAGWNWTPKPPPGYCDMPDDVAIDMTASAVGDGAGLITVMRPSLCERSQPAPAEIIQSLHAKFKDWRNYRFKEATEASANWRDYVTAFTTMQSNAYRFYGDIIEQIFEQQHKAPTAANLDIYQQQTFMGLPFSPAGSVCQIDDVSRQILHAGIAEAEKSAGEAFFDAAQAAVMRYQILPGLYALDCARPFANFNQVVDEMKRDRSVSIAGESQAQLVEHARRYAAQKMLATLHQYVYYDSNYGLHGVPENGAGFDYLAEGNPFLRLHKILQHPTPFPAGEQYIMEANNSAFLVNQDSKNEHPSRIRRASTPSMSEYLMASMVCGPNTERGDRMTDNQIRNDLKPRLFDFGDQNMTPVKWGFKPAGYSIPFIPPQVVRNVGFDFCDHIPNGQNSLALMFNPHDAVWAVGGVEYHGFLDVVRRNIAPEILKPNQNGKASFPEWWAQHVDGHLIAAIGLLKTEYNNLMVRDFVPRLQDQAYNEYHGRKFALGAKNSMLDEVNIDLDYIESTFRAGRPANRPEVAQFAKLRSDVQHRFQVALSFLGTAAELRNAVRVADIELTGKDSGNSAKVRYQADVEAKTAYRSYRLMLMREIVALNEAAALPGGASTPTIDQVRKSASTTLMDIIDEMDSYYGIMSTIEL